ncbi:MAG: ATP-binding cassette domain-containing protein, partial [Pseudolysinimonas sp.]
MSRVFRGPPAVHALGDVDLTIAAGDFVAIEGPSGGGKSTLLNVIGLLDRADDGRYLLDGADIGDSSDDERAALRSDGFSFVFQSFHLLDRRPVLDSVGLGLLYRGVPKSDRDTRSRAALASLGIEQLAESRAHLLSGGERQRVAIARALATGSPVLVADEPTGNLDSANSARVVEALRKVNDEGATVVLVTHSPEVAAAAGRRVRIRDGKMVEGAVGPEAAPRSTRPRPPGRASVIRLRDLLDDAAAGLASRRGRTAGLVLAVTVAVGLAVGSAGLATSAHAQVADTFDAHANRDVTAQWTPGEDDATDELAQRLASLPGVESAGVVDDLGPHAVAAMLARPGLAVALYRARSPVVESARFSLADGWPPPVSGVLLGQNLADQLDARIVPGAIILLDGRPVEVAGIVTASPRIPEIMGAVVSLGGVADSSAAVRRIALVTTGSGAAQQVARQVPLVIDPTAPDSIEVFAPVDPGTLRAEIESDVLTTLLAFSGIAGLAATLALGNAMVMAVLERQAELGLRRAVGARRRHVTALVLVESVMIGAVGGVLGLVAGLLVIAGITIANRWAPVFDPVTAPL